MYLSLRDLYSLDSFNIKEMDRKVAKYILSDVDDIIERIYDSIVYNNYNASVASKRHIQESCREERDMYLSACDKAYYELRDSLGDFCEKYECKTLGKEDLLLNLGKVLSLSREYTRANIKLNKFVESNQ